MYPQFTQLILDAAKPVKGFLGLRRLGRKFPPTVQTENELHMEAEVPKEETDEVSKLSFASLFCHSN